MRAFALLMMIQGHTIHSLLDVSYSSSNSQVYSVWILLRGITAPVFIFVSGFIFTYLLFQKEISYKKNSRVGKGIVRGVSLILIGYLLRYPTINIFNIANVSSSHWVTFFAVDALQLIGVGLLLIVSFAFIFRITKTNLLISFAILSLIVFALSPIINSVGWSTYKDIFFVSYITSQFGSIFPLFPYLGYMFLGSVFGLLLKSNHEFFKKNKYIATLIIAGSIIILFPLLIESQYSSSIFSIGAILFLLPIFGLLSKKNQQLPKPIHSIAKNSLWIYIIHLIIIYGSPASIGLFQIVGKTQPAFVAIFAAVLMVIFMTIISLGIDKFKATKFKNV